MNREEAIKIFKLKIEPYLWKDPKENGCWIFYGATDRRGYGTISFGYGRKGTKVVKVHRISFLAFSSLDSMPGSEIFICHTCDNPPCCKPEHLFMGDNVANINDAAEKGRLHSNLTKEQVIEIKYLLKNASYGNLRGIAKTFNVSPQTISNIKYGRHWKWIKPLELEQSLDVGIITA